MDTPILEIKDVVIEYDLKKYSLRAVDCVSMRFLKGSVTAIVGESGSGKTTLATSILEVISSPGHVKSGSVLYYQDVQPTLWPSTPVDGRFVTDISKLNPTQLNHYRWQECSMVFQGAQSSLNPVMTIYEQFYETMEVHHVGNISSKEMHRIVHQRAREVLEIVHLDVDRILPMYPHELSGGMKQRVIIAFSLLLNPKIIILDEPTTALDVITQDNIFRVLKKINKEMGITMILLTHDMGVVAKFADFVGVMYAGKLVEYGTALDVFKNRLHPYTHGLIGATPSILADHRSLKPIEGNPPDIMNLPKGCPFHPRCDRCFEKCRNQTPSMTKINEEWVSCHLFDEAGDSSHE